MGNFSNFGKITIFQSFGHFSSPAEESVTTTEIPSLLRRCSGVVLMQQTSMTARPPIKSAMK
jgi:hypothetical protein